MSISKRNISIGIVVVCAALIAFAVFKYSFRLNDIRMEAGTTTTDRLSDWAFYEDRVFGFRIPYPGHLHVFPIEPKENPDDRSPDAGVSFANVEGPGTMGVKIYKNVPYQSTGEWLARQNVERETLRKEQVIQIDGYEALVTYNVSVMQGFEETFPKEKRTVFLKEGDLYEIWTNSYSNPEIPQIVWQHFQFDPTLIRE